MLKRAVTYFDNAASTWPKPPEVIRAMEHILLEVGANPGRSGHDLSIEAAREIFEARDALASLFNADNPLRIVFTKNATEALNIAITGLLKPGDHVITSSMEHNSVMRPLRMMGSKGIKITVIGCSRSGRLDPADAVSAIRPETRAFILTHASNVTGTIQPVAEVGAIARHLGIIFCVDAAQTAGAVPIDIPGMNIDLLAFTGHKSLYGPQGTGGLYIGPGIEERISPLMTGGTGSASELEMQPDFMPDKFESGTPNTPGIAGLLAGVRFIQSQGIEAIRGRERGLAEELRKGLASIPDVRVYGDPMKSIPLVSFTIEGMSPSDVTLMLDEEYGIMARPGLHCAPSAHRTIDTFPQGTVRFSLGWFNTEEEIRYALDAVSKIASIK
jgi:cysteine desulfurase family protein